MKKIISLFLTLIMVFALAAGTGVFADALPGDVNGDGELDNKDVVLLFRYASAKKDGEYDEKYDYNGDGAIDNKDVVELFRKVTGSDDLPDFLDGIIGGRTPSDHDPYSGEWEADKEAGYGVRDDALPTECEPYPGYVEEYPDDIYYPDAVAGTLSAGEWKDADNISDWQNLLSGEDWQRYISSRRLDTRNVITVKVVDGENICFNVPVKLLSGDDVIYIAKTDVNGFAYLFDNITGNEKTADAVAVGDEIISIDGRTELTVNAADAGIEVTALDLMLMIDTTGSMGDELEYIKAELYDVVERVAESGQNISIRVSVNFYRDEGDDYVVKYYDFRSDVNECVEQIKKEHAYGGGDYPEAVHTALENAVTGHRWREEAVKLCFIVLDAPPHSESEIQGVNAELLKTVKAAAEQGIRIIPVASSGVNGETEFLLRSWALMTGGTYVFITNDSGIGYEHKEAEVGEHTVEYLNECMIRIACQYCGIFSGEMIPYTQPYHQ